MACCLMAGSVYLCLNHYYDTFKFDPTKDQVISNLKETNDVYSYNTTHHFKVSISGMFCVNCSTSVEDGLRNVVGVESVHVSFMDSRAIIVYDPILNSHIRDDALDKINSLGYEATVFEDEKELINTNSLDLKKLYYRFIKSGVYAFLTFIFQSLLIRFDDYIWRVLLMTICVVSGLLSQLNSQLFAKQAWSSLKSGRLGMPILITVSTLAILSSSLMFCYKYLISGDPQNLRSIHLDSSTGLLFVVYGGKYLESITKSSLSSNLTKLDSLLPESVVLYNDPKNPVSVPSEFIQAGDIVLIRPGSKIPTDGSIIQNTSYIDELIITGEPKPVLRKEGSLVMSGTLNLTNQIIVESTSTAEGSNINKVLSSLKTQGWKHIHDLNYDSYEFVELLLSVFVPFILSLSVSVFVFYYYHYKDFEYAQLRSLSTLTIACPCALGLSVPCVLVSGINVLSQVGIYARKHSIGILKKILDSSITRKQKALLLLDKTGTLTLRDLQVSNLEYLIDETDKNLLWRTIYEVEKFEAHPIAESITKFSQSQLSNEDHIASIQISDFKVIPTSGVEASFTYNDETHKVSIGNYKVCDDLQKLRKTKDIYVMVDNEVVMSFNLKSDVIRTDSSELINFFKTFNVEPVLLSGDQLSNCSKVANLLNIDLIHSSLTPLEKLSITKRYKDEGYRLIMVGDGLNDSPSLKYADISICLKTGHQTAIDSSDFILMHDRLNAIPDIYDVGAKVQRKIFLNLATSLIYNIVLILLATGVMTCVDSRLIVDINWSSTLMSLSSVFVVLNSRIHR